MRTFVIPFEPKGASIQERITLQRLITLNFDEDIVALEDNTKDLLRSAKAKVRDHARRQSVYAAPHSPFGSLAGWVWLRVRGLG